MGFKGRCSSLSMPIGHPTKMYPKNVKGSTVENWKKESEHLFFVEKKSMVDIAREVGRTRKYVAEHLQSLSGYEAERERRKQSNQKKREAAKREWDQKNKKRDNGRGENDRAMLLNDHIQAVRELSHEKYH